MEGVVLHELVGRRLPLLNLGLLSVVVVVVVDDEGDDKGGGVLVVITIKALKCGPGISGASVGAKTRFMQSRGVNFRLGYPCAVLQVVQVISQREEAKLVPDHAVYSGAVVLEVVEHAEDGAVRVVETETDVCQGHGVVVVVVVGGSQGVHLVLKVQHLMQKVLVEDGAEGGGGDGRGRVLVLNLGVVPSSPDDQLLCAVNGREMFVKLWPLCGLTARAW
eukprot:GHVL01023864.1.p2 GENE.GHVL01023864.1~~GHVL01023864.1.p2  ORF type:complete len:220 (+),score=15.50 GHVL01023864.1:106-765(+)